MTVLVRKEARRDWRGVWLLRLTLAACLAFGSEVLLWTEVTRAAWLWLPVSAGYVAVACLLLDVMHRARVVELFGLLVLVGVYGVLNGVLLNPSVALASLPTSLVTRVMGAQVIAGLVGVALFLALRGADEGRLLFVGALPAGAAWGVWVRGYPVIADARPASLALLVGVGGGAVIVLIALAVLVQQARDLPPDNLRLTLREWGIVGAVLVGLFALAWVRGAEVREALPFAVVILSYLGVVLWFQRRQVPGSLLTAPATPPTLMQLGGAALVFVAAGALAYQIPPPTSGDTLSPLSMLTLFFSVFGLAWLPTVSLVLGVRAYRQSVRTGGKLL